VEVKAVIQMILPPLEAIQQRDVKPPKIDWMVHVF